MYDVYSFLLSEKGGVDLLRNPVLSAKKQRQVLPYSNFPNFGSIPYLHQF